MTPERMSFEAFGTEVERVLERVEHLRPHSGVFWIDVYGPVPADVHDPAGCAAAAYGKVTRVTGARSVRVKEWRGLFRASFRRRAGLAGEMPDWIRRDLAFQLDWLCELITETLGPLRAAAVVEHAPKSWYAALWEDWLLVGEESAVVLSLINDS